jgi:hypothetical protein
VVLLHNMLMMKNMRLEEIRLLNQKWLKNCINNNNNERNDDPPKLVSLTSNDVATEEIEEDIFTAKQRGIDLVKTNGR